LQTGFTGNNHHQRTAGFFPLVSLIFPPVEDFNTFSNGIGKDFLCEFGDVFCGDGRIAVDFEEIAVGSFDVDVIGKTEIVSILYNGLSVNIGLTVSRKNVDFPEHCLA
jgi:hypothetical protein